MNLHCLRCALSGHKATAVTSVTPPDSPDTRNAAIAGPNGNIETAAEAIAPVEKMTAPALQRPNVAKPPGPEQSRALITANALTIVDARSDCN